MSEGHEWHHYRHKPVLLQALLDILNIDPNGVYVDATYGCGGHSAAVLARLGPTGSLLAFDRDPQACRQAQNSHGADPRFSIRHASFASIRFLLDEGWRGSLAGIFFDLGVSSPQLDSPQRGFSFSKDGPLDMRMDTDAGITAAQWINGASKGEIARVLKTYGEERRAKSIANAIAGGRPLQTTRQLATLVTSALGSCNRNVHPATRTFLAIRLYLNRELEALQEALGYVPALLRGGARLIAISFHSLEDRIVKRFIRDHSRDSHDYGQAVFHRPAKAVTPSPQEKRDNPRCRSARLRWAEKI